MHDRLAAQDYSTRDAKDKRATEEGTAPLKPVFVHGWVYDLESGIVTDLNVSTGPKGFESFVPSEAISQPKESGANMTKPEKAKPTTTTTQESAAETSKEAPPEKKVEDVMSEPAAKELGHYTIPLKRSNMLARLRRSLSQQGGRGERFSRQI